MKMGLEIAAFGCGIAVGILAGMLIAAPLLGWHLDEAASTVVSAAVGAAAAVFGAVFYELWRERSRDRVRQWKQVMLIYPAVFHLHGKLDGLILRLEDLAKTPSFPREQFNLAIKLDVEPLAGMLTDVDVLERGLAQDLLNLVGWGRQLDEILELKLIRINANDVRFRAVEIDDALRHLHGVVKACVDSAAAELERLRLRFQAETQKEEAARKKG